MVLNAKEYNEKGSQIYDDAERLRKGFSNYMTKVNPAYKVHGFVVTPVALPGEESVDDEVEPEVEEPIAAKRGKIRGSKPAAKSPPPPAWKVAKYAGKGFSALTFQQAQEKVVEDMILFNDDPKNLITTFEDFVELPPKDLKDYYAVIQDPRSLQTLWEQVQGIDIGKKSAPTGVSKFSNWDEFEAEASIIWANAFHYNEDDSEIFNLAKELEVFFYKELESAKKAVPGPPGPKKIMLKIGGNKAPQPQPPQNPRITLKLAGQKGSPAPSPVVQSSGASGANGNGHPANGTGRRNPFGGSVSAAVGVPNLDQLERARSMSDSVASPTISSATAVKNEDGRRNSPAVAPNPNYRASSQAVSTPGVTAGMPPPSTPGVTQSYSQSGGFAQSFNHQLQYPVSNPAFESKWRQPGKDASDAMITNLSLSTHPGLNIPNHLQMNLPPSDTMTQQSVTINLPSTHYFLQIKPTIALSLLERQHKLFITLNNQRLHAMPLIPGHPLDPRHPLFEGRLLPGVNRLEIELIASLPKGVTKPANGPDTDLEKITVFANLLKAT